MNTTAISEDAKPRLLVTGASGFLGHALITLALPHWSVAALYRRHRPRVAGAHAIQVDLTDAPAVKHLVRTLAPAAIIHTAAVAQPGICEAHPRQTATINVDVPVQLAGLCAEGGIDYLFTSTDLVFDGQQAPYDEGATVNPVCIYGEQKAQAEQMVLQRYSPSLVCRLPLMVGMAPYAQGNFCMQMLKAFGEGEALNLLTDEYRTPVDNNSAARGILHVLGRSKGLLHLGGRTRISRFELGRLMTAEMSAPSHLARPVTIDELGLDVSRPPDCSLLNNKAYKLGYNPLSLSAALQAIVDKYKIITNV